LNHNHYIPTGSVFSQAIHSIWQVEGYTSFQKEHIIPKGVVEIIFNFSDGNAIPVRVDEKQYSLASCFINGFNTTSLEVQLPAQQRFFGIQLQPLAVKKIFGVPASEFSNQIVDLSLLDPVFHSLWHQLAEQTSFDGKLAVFTSWLEKKLPVWQPQETLINTFLTSTGRHDQSVKELALSLCYSTRQLSRKMAETTGMNTEEILLYKKYLHAVHLIHHTDWSLTKIAYQSNFSDQSHFIKSFKSYTNMTPGEYRASKSYVKGHIYENVR
jgi:AraC-like DNA-binding protein